MAKSWREKHDDHKHPVHVETLARPFGGLPSGTRIVIATPREMTEWFRSIPRGKTRSMEQLRQALANKFSADAACPLTTSIFCRIAAEHSFEQIQMGAKRAAPFWRAIDPASSLAKRLGCGPDFIYRQRAAEGVIEIRQVARERSHPGAPSRKK